MLYTMVSNLTTLFLKALLCFKHLSQYLIILADEITTHVLWSG